MLNNSRICAPIVMTRTLRKHVCTSPMEPVVDRAALDHAFARQQLYVMQALSGG